jgi:hypothetical protein
VIFDAEFFDAVGQESTRLLRRASTRFTGPGHVDVEVPVVEFHHDHPSTRDTSA